VILANDKAEYFSQLGWTAKALETPVGQINVATLRYARSDPAIHLLTHRSFTKRDGCADQARL
jgi:hypothetical protein